MHGRTKDRDPSPASPAAVPAADSPGSDQPAPATEEFFQDAFGMPLEEFLSNIVGQRAYGPHATAARLQAADVAVMADIDYMLSQARFRGADAEPIRNSAARPPGTTDAGSGADPAYLYGQFAKGTAIRFLNAHRYLPRVAGFAAELGAALAEAIGANIYLTPANGEGLDRHCDSHDTIVLQCVGSKRWRLHVDDYADASERPTGTAANFDDERQRPGRVEREMDLTPGDILYLPGGIMREVAPPSGDSLHVAFAIHTLTVAELAHRALRLATAEMEGLGAPVALAMRLQAKVDDHFAAELATALSSRHLADALKEYRRMRRKTTLRVPAEHWFGSHRGTADGSPGLAVKIADRARSHERRRRSTAKDDG